MNMHFFVLSLAGAVVVGGVWLLIRVLRYRSKRQHLDAVIAKAVSQMRQTGIFLSLGMNPLPADIEALQTQLKKHWGYQGEIDGILNAEMLEAIDRMAQARGVDVEAEAIKIFTPTSSQGVLPDEMHRDLVMRQAKDRLDSARKSTGHGGQLTA